MAITKTQIGIIGAGPSGLLLAQMLYNRGIETVILESRDRAYVRARLRAGIQENATMDIFIEEGVGARLQKERLIHKGMFLNFNNEQHYINAEELTGGKVVGAYGQRNITCDMIDILEASEVPLLFEAKAHSIEGLNEKKSKIHYTYKGKDQVLECDFIAGCDGFHGISRNSIPKAILKSYEKVYPYSWFGILAEVPPASPENIYAHSDWGFALQSMRGTDRSRLYLQVPADEDISRWTDTAFFDEFERRIGAGYAVNRGEIIDRSIAHMRGYVCEPMRFGKLFLAGDSAHIVPPTGAKGMNLAVADVKVLGEAFKLYYKHNDPYLLDHYSEICLNRVWKVERFSWWFTTTTHTSPDLSVFDSKMQFATLRYLVDSNAGLMSIAENYVGLPFEPRFLEYLDKY